VMSMLNTSTTTMIAASPGYEVVTVEMAGELQRCPVVAGGLVSTYAFDGGCILPVGDAHAIVMPNERVLATAGGSPRGTRTPRHGRAPSTKLWHARLD